MSESKLPPQQPPDRSDAKPSYTALKYSRRCYEISGDPEYMEISVFWLNGDNSRDPIQPWWQADRVGADLVGYLRSKGYITTEEAANRE